MKSSKILALGMLSFFAAYGCGDSEPASSPTAAESEVVGFKGNVDHVGIVEAGTILLTTSSNPILDLNLDSYNREDPFNIRGTSFRDTFAKNLVKFDAIDGKTDWTPAQTSMWLARIASSYMVIDTSKPCDFAAAHTYLEIERAALTGKPHTTCGGRTPNEDALDVTMNFLARGPAASSDGADVIRDEVDQATQRSTAQFPYLADLNTDD
jgi:hypothetical protein